MLAFNMVLIRGSQITESVQLAIGSSALFRFVRVRLPWKLLFRLSCRIKHLGVGISGVIWVGARGAVISAS